VARGPTGFVLFNRFRGHRLFAVQAWSVGNFEEVSVEAAPKRWPDLIAASIARCHAARSPRADPRIRRWKWLSGTKTELAIFRVPVPPSIDGDM